METVKGAMQETSIGSQTSANLRIKIYQLFGSLILEKPYRGQGLMAGVQFRGEESDMDRRGIHLGVRTPHNIQLQIIFDIGATGVALVFLSFIWPIWRWKTENKRALAYSALLALVLVLAGSLFNFVIWRTWIPSAGILTFYFLLISFPKKEIRF
jgi:O-antigen ligase